MLYITSLVHIYFITGSLYLLTTFIQLPQPPSPNPSEVKVVQSRPTLGDPTGLEFSRPEYRKGQPFPSLGDLPNPGIELRSPIWQADSLPAEPQGKPKNTGMGSLFLLQGIFSTQESNWGFLHCRWISLPSEL